MHVIDSNDGHEVMGFIPKALMRSTVDSAGKPDGIQALTFQDGGVPIYKHHFYVDSSPRTSDVDFNSEGVTGSGHPTGARSSSAASARAATVTTHWTSPIPMR